MVSPCSHKTQRAAEQSAGVAGSTRSRSKIGGETWGYRKCKALLTPDYKNHLSKDPCFDFLLEVLNEVGYFQLR